MTALSPGRFWQSLLLLLVGAALLFLQVSNAAEGLLVDLPAYGLIAIAGVLGFASLRFDSRIDFLCFTSAALFGLWIVVRSVTSRAPYNARADLYLVLAASVIYMLVSIILTGSTGRIALILGLLIFAVWHVLVGLAQFGLGENLAITPFLQRLTVTSRASGLYGNPDHLAGLLEILAILGVSVACWSRLPGWARVVVGYLALTCYIGLALTASRGGYLSATASLVVFAILSLLVLRAGKPSLLRTYGAIALIIVVVAIFGARYLIYQSPALRERLTNIVTVDTSRVDMWRAALDQWKLQPLIGTGGGTYRFYGRQFRSERLQADPVYVHNDYLNLLCDYGLVGALSFLLFFGLHMRRGWNTFLRIGPKRLGAGAFPRSNRLALNIGAFCVIAAYAVHSLVDFNMHLPANALLIAFVFGILANPGTRFDSQIPGPATSPALRVALVLLSAFLLWQCIRLYPGEYFAGRARSALENEHPAEAVALANKALAYEKRNPNIYFYFGRAFAALGDKERSSGNRFHWYEGALAAFDAAHRLCPLDGTYPLDAAYLYDAMGRFSEAEWMYDLARARDPRSVNIANLYKFHIDAWRHSSQQK